MLWFSVFELGCCVPPLRVSCEVDDVQDVWVLYVGPDVAHNLQRGEAYWDILHVTGALPPAGQTSSTQTAGTGNGDECLSVQCSFR
jgi:hypothetical protein